MSSAIDVCEGCRRLRKRCDKDNCVLHPCLESLWPNNRQSQGNATVFLAKYFGRKRFFKLLEAVTSQQRAALFESLMQEACGRTVNPIGGATGLYKLGRWTECEMAVTTVLNGESLHPIVVDAPSTPPTKVTMYLLTGPRGRAQVVGQSYHFICDHTIYGSLTGGVPNDVPVEEPAQVTQNEGAVEEPVEMIQNDDPVEESVQMIQNDDPVQESVQMNRNDNPVEEKPAVALP